MRIIGLPPAQKPQSNKLSFGDRKKLNIEIDEYSPDLSDTVDITIDVPKECKHRNYLILGKNVTLKAGEFSLNKLIAGDNFRYVSNVPNSIFFAKESANLANNAKIEGNFMAGSLTAGNNFNGNSISVNNFMELGNQSIIKELTVFDNVTLGSVNELDSIFLLKKSDDGNDTRTLKFKSCTDDIKPKIKLFLGQKLNHINIHALDENILNKIAIFTRTSINDCWKNISKEEASKNLIKFFKIAST